MKFLGLHPLIWAVIVVVSIAVGRACDNVEALGCDFFEWYENEDSDEEDDHDQEDDQDREDRPDLED